MKYTKEQIKFYKFYMRAYKHRDTCKKWEKGKHCIECGFAYSMLFEEVFGFDLPRFIE